jgi:hypothetical protein
MSLNLSVFVDSLSEPIHRGKVLPGTLLMYTRLARKRCRAAWHFSQYVRATNCYKLSDGRYPDGCLATKAVALLRASARVASPLLRRSPPLCPSENRNTVLLTREARRAGGAGGIATVTKRSQTSNEVYDGKTTLPPKTYTIFPPYHPGCT